MPDICDRMDTALSFLRRIGPEPNADGTQCAGCRMCPDIWELEVGDFAIIGIDITAAAVPNLPATAGCGPDERIVFIPRNLLVKAKSDIPSA